MPILWLPRRCVFDGFLPEFEGFKGYVRPLPGRLSLAGWAGILLGLCRFGCVPTTGVSMLLALSTACLGTSSAATTGILLSALSLFESYRLKVFPVVHRRCVFDGFLQEFEGFKGYVRPLSGRLSLAGWAGILLGLCRFGCVPTTGASMLVAVSKACLGTSSAATTGILLSALSLIEPYRLTVFAAVRTGAFRADFVASKKVRFRWLPTGV